MGFSDNMKAGLRFRRLQRKRLRETSILPIDDYTYDKINALLDEGFLIENIANRFGVTQRSVKALLKRYKQECRFITVIFIEIGRLKRPDKCSVCGVMAKTKSCKIIHAHHVDYRSPSNILWLCSKCHGKEHARLNKLRPF